MNLLYCTIYLEVSSADNLCKQFRPIQVEEYVRPDLDPNCLTPHYIPEGFFLNMLIMKEDGKKNIKI